MVTMVTSYAAGDRRVPRGGIRAPKPNLILPMSLIIDEMASWDYYWPVRIMSVQNLDLDLMTWHSPESEIAELTTLTKYFFPSLFTLEETLQTTLRTITKRQITLYLLTKSLWENWTQIKTHAPLSNAFQTYPPSTAIHLFLVVICSLHSDFSRLSPKTTDKPKYVKKSIPSQDS